MITKFENFNLITETPDHIIDKDGNKYHLEEIQAIPFYMTVNEDHTKVTNLYLGKKGDYHQSVEYVYDRAFPGRIWLDSKIMAFWVYPNEILFKDFIKTLEDKLNIKIFNNGWRIEIISKHGEKVVRDLSPTKTDYYFGDDYDNDYKYDIIPIEKYIGSEDVTEEEKILHLMSWKEKELAKKIGKFHFKGIGSNKTSWDQPKNIRFRQALYQENKRN